VHIAIGCDHRGLSLKQFIIKLLAGARQSYKDFGTHTADPVDYPDIAKRVAKAVAKGNFEYGILICDTGIGMCIAANKVKGIRAARCDDAFSVRRARQHNDANILCLAARKGQEQIPKMIEAFLASEFEGGRHQRRLDKIRAMEGI